MSEAPPFWFEAPGIPAWALSPAGFIYGRIAGSRMRARAKYVSPLPVICVGNFVLGGAGKTPTVLAFAKIARSMGLRPGFLSRGYGGSATQALLVDPEKHNSSDVGDEPLLLARVAPTVVSSDRQEGAKLLEKQDVDIVFMDDGFQNPSLHKDYTMAVIDAHRGIGNGLCVPAGPMRADLESQLFVASSVLVIGHSEGATTVVRRAAKMAKPIFQADLEVSNGPSWKGRKVLAFAGIADPNKFYRSLEKAGANVVDKVGFDDHHPFSDEECQDLLTRARDEKLILATTEKDHIRLKGMGKEQEELRKLSDVLSVELNFENPKLIQQVIENTKINAKEFRRDA